VWDRARRSGFEYPCHLTRLMMERKHVTWCMSLGGRLVSHVQDGGLEHFFLREFYSTVVFFTISPFTSLIISKSPTPGHTL